MRIAQLGFGRWGRNLLRAFARIDEVELALVCDPEPSALAAVPSGVERALDASAAFERRDIDAIVIATPPELHHAQAREALAAGKHTFVEKPLSLDVDHAKQLVDLAASSGRTLMVGHVVLFDDAARWIKGFIDDGGLGRVHRASFRRRGRARSGRTLNALWNLAPHDLSLADYWFGESPSGVEAFGWSSRADGLDEESVVELRYPCGREVDIRVGWLVPSGERRAILVGSESTLVYETAPAARLVVHRPRADAPQVIELGPCEPLRREAEHFVDCVRARRAPLSDGASGLRVVSTLAAATRSRDARVPVAIHP